MGEVEDLKGYGGCKLGGDRKARALDLTENPGISLAAENDHPLLDENDDAVISGHEYSIFSSQQDGVGLCISAGNHFVLQSSERVDRVKFDSDHGSGSINLNTSVKIWFSETQGSPFYWWMDEFPVSLRTSSNNQTCRFKFVLIQGHTYKIVYVSGVLEYVLGMGEMGCLVTSSRPLPPLSVIIRPYME